MKRRIHGREDKRTFRRGLRSAQTSAEAVLWAGLRRKQLGGRRFRRQHSVGPYVVDFYCPSERLVIEVDGGIHDRPERLDYENERDRYLRSLGLRVLHFSNESVLKHGSEVLGIIRSHFRPVVDSDAQPRP